MSDTSPGTDNLETATANLLVHQLVLRGVAMLAAPSESAEITMKLRAHLESDIANLMRIYWENQDVTIVPRIAARLQQVIDKLDTAENLAVIVDALIQMSQLQATNEDGTRTSESGQSN